MAITAQVSSKRRLKLKSFFSKQYFLESNQHFLKKEKKPLKDVFLTNIFLYVCFKKASGMLREKLTLAMSSLHLEVTAVPCYRRDSRALRRGCLSVRAATNAQGPY